MSSPMDKNELDMFQYKLIEYRDHLQAQLDAFNHTEYGDRSNIERRLNEATAEVKHLRAILRKIKENNKSNMGEILRIARQIKAVNQLIRSGE